jgi:heavy metal sensor kinase
VRLPIRVRLTVFYACLLSAIIAALGTFLVVQLTSHLQSTVDRHVRESALHIARAYAAEGSEDFLDASRTALPADGLAQIVDRSGRVLHSFGTFAGDVPIVGVRETPALSGHARLITVHVGGNEAGYRASASPVRRLGNDRVLIVAESLADAHENVEHIVLVLLLAGPAALLITALGGWGLARHALRPVERMTSQAQEIGINRLQERIAVPPVMDEVGNLAVTLNAMLDRLEQGVRSKHQLIADASHDLRTPLAVMRAELDVSLRANHLGTDARDVLESTREEVDRMTRTVDNLLTLAQVDEGRLELLTAPLDLKAAIEAAARPLRTLAAAKGVVLDVGGESCEVRADPQRLEQALTNLIENAIKFTHSGGRVRVTAWRGGREVGITVADNGPGMPATARSQVFERFYRADPARGRDAGGSGLGLAICREVAVAHGGRVWVDSEEGKGSEFSLALPLTQ